jgi:hypothetical protein
VKHGDAAFTPALAYKPVVKFLEQLRVAPCTFQFLPVLGPSIVVAEPLRSVMQAAAKMGKLLVDRTGFVRRPPEPGADPPLPKPQSLNALESPGQGQTASCHTQAEAGRLQQYARCQSADPARPSHKALPEAPPKAPAPESGRKHRPSPNRLRASGSR